MGLCHVSNEYVVKRYVEYEIASGFRDYAKVGMACGTPDSEHVGNVTIGARSRRSR